MLVKAQIKSVVDNHRISVYMPSIQDEWASHMAISPSKSTTECVVTVPPGIFPDLQVLKNQNVIVGFENDDPDSPVFLGIAYNDNCSLDSDSGMPVDMKAREMIITSGATLPKETTIGEVDADEIACLDNIKDSVQGQLQDLHQRGLNVEERVIRLWYCPSSTDEHIMGLFSNLADSLLKDSCEEEEE